MSQTEDSTLAAGAPVERPVRPLRVAATILVPLLVLCAGYGMAALTQWLDQFLAGKAMMVLLLAGFVGVMARVIWTLPEWRSDDEAERQLKRRP